MVQNNIISAQAYYQTMNNKNLSGMAKHLHPDAQLIGPMSETRGKEAILDAAKGFMASFKTLTIRTAFGSDNQVVLIYNLECPAPIGIIRAAALMTFKDGLIIRNELFYDTRPLS